MNHIRLTYRVVWEGVLYASSWLSWAARGGGALSLSLNVFLLSLVGLGAIAGMSSFPSAFQTRLSTTFSTANLAISFLCVLLLTFAATVGNRALKDGDPRAPAARRAAEFFLAAAYSAFIALALGFSTQVVNRQTLAASHGLTFDLLRLTASVNPFFIVINGMGAAWSFLLAVVNTEQSLNPVHTLWRALDAELGTDTKGSNPVPREPRRGNDDAT